MVRGVAAGGDRSIQRGPKNTTQEGSSKIKDTKNKNRQVKQRTESPQREQIPEIRQGSKSTIKNTKQTGKSRGIDNYDT